MEKERDEETPEESKDVGAGDIKTPPMSGEEMREYLQAMQEERVANCTAELQAVLDKYNCSLRATVTLPADNFTIVPKAE